MAVGFATIRMGNLLVYWSRRSHEYFIYCDNKPPQTERIAYSKFGRGRVSWLRYHMSQENQLKLKFIPLLREVNGTSNLRTL